jgi:tRNA pseudouridine38-40 synthase
MSEAGVRKTPFQTVLLSALCVSAVRPLPAQSKIQNPESKIEMRTLRAILQYDGTDFHGFQVQPGLVTVQAVMEAKLARVLQEPVRVAAAGRTDAGVHASGQVISFRTDGRIPVERLAVALNSLPPYTVVVKEAQPAPESFHARFSARSRSYQYVLLRGTPSPFLRRFAVSAPELRRVDRMRAALPYLIGKHDFTSFCAAGAEALHKERTVFCARVLERGRLVLFRITADGFLQQMVRTIVGTLLEVERGKREPAEIAGVLAGRDRRLAGPTAPAHGLCFTRATYEASDVRC